GCRCVLARDRRDQGRGGRGDGAPARISAQVYERGGLRAGGPHPMMISRELEVTLGLALREAVRRQHEYLTLEHVLYALLHDTEVAEVLRNCGGNVDQLKREVDQYLTDKVERMSAARSEPQQTLGFRRVLQRAALHVQSAGK